MKYLFITRKNVHAKYYSGLIKRLALDCQLIITGKPSLKALLYLKEAMAISLGEIVGNQVTRKKAKGAFWRNKIVNVFHRQSISAIETLRLAKYLHLLRNERPDYVVLWNGKKLPNATVKLAADYLGIDIFYFENGLLPGTTTLDPKGVNYSNSLSRDPRFYLNLAPTASQQQQYKTELIQREQHRNRKQQACAALPEKYIFVPFQVPHDTQIVSHSPWIDSMEALYHQVIQCLDEIGDPSLKAVFKEHPTWPKHYTSLYEQSDKGLFANANNTQELIDNAVGVITINSTVGLEGLLLDKPVITVGEACYNIDGLVLNALSSAELKTSITSLLNGWSPHQALKDNFFLYLANEYCIPGIRSEYTNEHLTAITERLQKSDRFSQQNNLQHAH